MFDLLIKDGLVIDGTGSKPAYRADVGVQDKHIAAVGNLTGAASDKVIDATGLIVSPGFIDTHAHSDGALLVDPQHENGLRQGITTEILAPDGLSYAPLSAEDYLMYRWYLSGLLGWPPDNLDMSSIKSFRNNYHKSTAINVVAVVPHGPLRISALGFRDTPLRGSALESAKRSLSDGIDQGGRGFSTGLAYFPQSYSDTKELIELSTVAARHQVPFIVHIREKNEDPGGGTAERAFGGGGITEALEVGRRSGAAVHIEHYRTEPDSAGRIDELLSEVDRAKSEGVEVTLETYPYSYGAGMVIPLLPSWIHDGGPEALLKRLDDPVDRRKAADHVDNWLAQRGGEDNWTYIGSAINNHLEGMSFADAAAIRNTSVADMIVDVISEERLTCGRRQTQPHNVSSSRQVEADVMALLAREDYMIGSDSIPHGEMCHPRAYGTFPRVVGRLRRRLGYPLHQVIQRLTDNPARTFGLTKRGQVQIGYFADLVIFDDQRICDLATFDDPTVPPAGIPFVIVNGKIAVEREHCTGVLAGEAVP